MWQLYVIINTNCQVSILLDSSDRNISHLREYTSDKMYSMIRVNSDELYPSNDIPNMSCGVRFWLVSVKYDYYDSFSNNT